MPSSFNLSASTFKIELLIFKLEASTFEPQPCTIQNYMLLNRWQAPLNHLAMSLEEMSSSKMIQMDIN
jgi:hypothetical protein